MTPLDKYMSENEIRDVDLWHKLVDLHPMHYSYVGKIRKGFKVPSKKIAIAIEKVLNGAVTKHQVLFPEDYLTER